MLGTAHRGRKTQSKCPHPGGMGGRVVHRTLCPIAVQHLHYPRTLAHCVWVKVRQTRANRRVGSDRAVCLRREVPRSSIGPTRSLPVLLSQMQMSSTKEHQTYMVLPDRVWFHKVHHFPQGNTSLVSDHALAYMLRNSYKSQPDR
jgi:hypothetical protein